MTKEENAIKVPPETILLLEQLFFFNGLDVKYARNYRCPEGPLAIRFKRLIHHRKSSPEVPITLNHKEQWLVSLKGRLKIGIWRKSPCISLKTFKE